MNYFSQYTDQINDILGVIEFEDDDTDLDQLESDTDLDQDINCPRCQDSGCNYCLMCEY